MTDYSSEYTTSGTSPTPPLLHLDHASSVPDSPQKETEAHLHSDPTDVIRFSNARLREPIDRSDRTGFIERQMQQRLFEPPPRPMNVVGDAACRAFIEQYPVPPPSYPSGEQENVDVSLRQWSKSAKTHTTDQNQLCEYRYNRYIHCSGRILPAAQTSPRNWSEPPGAYPPDFVPLTSHCSEDIDAEIEEGRCHTSKLLLEYELDWRTQAEREDFLRQTEKPCRPPHGASPRKRIRRFKELDGVHNIVAHEPVPLLETGELPKPSDALLDYWNEVLEEQGMPEEVDFYPPAFRENRSDDRAHSPDDEEFPEHQFDGVNFNGMRETTGARPSDQQSRSEWQKLWQARFNLLNKKWEDVTDADKQRLIEDPDFLTELARMRVMFDNTPVKEIAQGLGIPANTLAKNLSRARNLPSYVDTLSEGIDFSKLDDQLRVVIHINGRNELKVLGAASDPTGKLLASLENAEAKTLKAALKLVRRRAREKKWDSTRRQEEETAAIKRVSETYAPAKAMLSSLEG